MDSTGQKSHADVFSEEFYRYATIWENNVRGKLGKENMPEGQGDVLGKCIRSLVDAISDGSTCTTVTPKDSAVLSGLETVTAGLSDTGAFVIDPENRFYLRRHYADEAFLADRAVHFAKQTADEIEAVIPPGAVSFDDRQTRAIKRALSSKFAIVSGGPGTGKTTLVATIIASLLAAGEKGPILLTAPTGKAASRMDESIRAQISEDDAKLVENATTLHRLLGLNRGQRPYYGNHRRLNAQTVIVDEASMIDLSLARALFEALPDDCRLILLGDRNQLASVDSGAVFAALAAENTFRNKVFPAVHLVTSHRFSSDSGIGKVAALIRDEKTDEALAVMKGGADDFELLAGKNTGKMYQELADGYAPYFEAVRNNPKDVAGAFEAFSKFQVLCALREGPFGTSTVNRQMMAKLSPAASDAPLSVIGTPVLMTENDYAIEVFNGEIGILLLDGAGNPKVFFEGREEGFSPAQIRSHDIAFAMTVHKSQGSEFGEVALVLPNRENQVLSRELVYTGLTRAKKKVRLYAAEKVLETAISTPHKRESGLESRIAEALGD